MSTWTESPVLAGAALVGARIAGMLLVAPFLRGDLFPWRLKIGVIGLLTLSALSSPAVGAPLFERANEWIPRLATSLEGWVLLGGEVLVGVVVGWSSFLVLAAARAAASLISQQAGLAAASIADPQGSAEATALPFFHAALTVFVFVTLDLHHSLIRLVFDSYAVLPPGALSLQALPGALAELVASVGTELVGTALTLALPLVLTLSFVSMAQGVLGRVLPEAELFTLGLPVRACVAIASLVVILPAMGSFVHDLLAGAIADGRVVLEGLGV